MTQTDFIAELEFLTTEQGGRKGYAKSGYRPHIEFDNYPEFLTSGQQTYIGKDIVNPGEMVSAGIGILATDFFCKRLYIGMGFKFCEGRNVVGFGKITDILNDSLKITENEKILNNLNLYPDDIIGKIKTVYGGFESEFHIIREMQELINSEKSLRTPRILRSMIYLFTKGKMNRNEVYEIAKTDWRDVLYYAEYDGKENRLRDFNNEFGKEEIKASR